MGVERRPAVSHRDAEMCCQQRGDTAEGHRHKRYYRLGQTPQSVTSADGKVSMVGTFAPVAIATGGDNTKLILSAVNKVYYPGKAMTIGCQRAYFQLNGITAGDSQNGANTINLLFDEEEATAISVVKDTESGKADADGWYTLDGRKLDGKPSQKGLYIYNGKKVIK